MLKVYESNRLEALAAAFAGVVREPLDDPFTPEIVVTQHAGMARWLSMRTAEHLGVCANLRFRLPEEMVWDAFRGALPGVGESAVPELTALGWRLMDELARLGDDPRFAAVRFYVASGGDVARFELAHRLAASFEQLLLYRPDWIAAWEAGHLVPLAAAAEEEVWQAELWRRAFAGTERHRARLATELMAALARPQRGARQPAWPARLSLFGIPALPPSTLAVVRLIAARRDVHLFLLNPCREYWSDIRSWRERARAAGDRDPAELHLAEGNPLLASLGGQGRELIALLQDASDEEIETVDRFADPGRATLLHHLQSDILELRDPGAGDRPPTRIPAADRSLRFNACHGTMREVEVLHDQLLDLFDEHPNLEPGDIVVLTPDIETYAPFIEAVFATAPEDRRIPFTIADRSLSAESALVAAFVALLELPRTRYDANRLLDLLMVPAVRRRFALEQADTERVRRWVHEAGIRWGVDGASRAAQDLPAADEHTWRFGLDRLMLGYALPADGASLFAGVLPYDEIEGSAARILGRAHAFANATFALRDELAGERTPAGWAETLGWVLDRFVRPTEVEEPDASAIRAALGELEGSAADAGFAAPISLDVVKHFLARRLERPAGGGSFLAGRVTFCAMVPMRSIPFEVVCMIGMSDGAFPRSQRPLGFDLIARSRRPRLGDRSRRDDDRYLFLEALLSARRCLLLSWVGSDIRDNSVRPPSVLVSELLDAVDRGYADADGASPLRERLVVRHPLQAFSRRYFTSDAERDARLFSYSRELCAASHAAGPGDAPPAFCSGALPPPPETVREIELEDLLRFFDNPARALLRDRLGIWLPEAEGQVDDREPFELGGLERFTARQELLRLQLAGCPQEEIRAALAAGGLLPHGRLAEVAFAELSAQVKAFVARLEPRQVNTTLPPLLFRLGVGRALLTGALTNLSLKGLLCYRCGKTRGKDALRAWIQHLVLAALEPPHVAVRTRWLGDDTALRFEAVAEPRARLAELVALYCDGKQEPVPLFPDSARAFVQAQRGGKKDPQKEAARTFEGGGFTDAYGEGHDPYIALAFRQRIALGPRFEQVAQQVVGRMLDAAIEEDA